MLNLTANPSAYASESLRKIIENAFLSAMEAGILTKAEIPAFNIEVPADKAHGDFSSNAAMASARTFRNAPVKIAAAIKDNLNFEGTPFCKCEVAGPGFLNFFLTDEWFADTVAAVAEGGENYGRTDFGQNEKVMVEFVSANPTGPMHLGNARGGTLGDCLAACLDASGHDVTREFYINDAGNQIERFSISLEARYLQIYLGEDAVEFPEDGYHGADIIDHAKNFAEKYGNEYVEADSETRRKALVEYALPLNIDKMRKDLEKYRITYDVWFPESTLHKSGAVAETLDMFKARGLTYEKDGAIWYKATEFGGEKDEVLVRQNGYPTYFAVDIAYHINKFKTREFNRVINIWGADHHGHVARLKGAMDAAGLDGNKLDIVLVQLVRTLSNGEVVRMSKRTGKAITLTNLIEEVPVDAARFFFDMREPGSSLDFDLELAAEESSQNPVYYVQYAHARICSILKNLAATGVEPRSCTKEELLALSNPAERELIFGLAQFPQEIIEAAKAYDPAKITHYLTDIATLFHKFYNTCRVKGEEEAVMQARIALCMATRQVIANALKLIKVEAPEVM
ncbi:MAG: arginine--tRNA ligase [Ruminococcaceae bacterium]|nr:arginine--tRNA ligase [Oscillospiraceae bacterium]